MTKPIIVGMNNPLSAREEFALYPWRCAAAVLADLYMGEARDAA